MASWLVRSSPDRVVQVPAQAGDIVLSSWARHLRAATCKYHLQLCKIEKSKIPKLCHNKGFQYIITEI